MEVLMWNTKVYERSEDLDLTVRSPNGKEEKEHDGS